MVSPDICSALPPFATVYQEGGRKSLAQVYHVVEVSHNSGLSRAPHQPFYAVLRPELRIYQIASGAWTNTASCYRWVAGRSE